MSYLATHEAAKNQVDLYHNLRNFLTLNCSTEFRDARIIQRKILTLKCRPYVASCHSKKIPIHVNALQV